MSREIHRNHRLPTLVFLLLPLLSPFAAGQDVVVTAPPSLPSEAPEFVDSEKFTSAILNSTNVYRENHNASAVVWNETRKQHPDSFLAPSGLPWKRYLPIEEFASDYLDSTCEFKHSGGPYGENLAIGCANATSCVEGWGNEGEEFNYGDADFDEETGHFTQLVWKDTTDVGCARKLCEGDSGWYLACEYWPRGNVIGNFEQEIGRPENAAAVVNANWFVLGLTVVLLAVNLAP